MNQENIDEWLASGKHVVSFGAGMITILGWQSLISPQDLITDFDHIFNGIKEICIGAGPLIGVGMALWSRYKASLPSKVASVQAAQPQALVQAVQAVAPVVLRDAVAAQPDVREIKVTTEAIASASPSPKVST